MAWIVFGSVIGLLIGFVAGVFFGWKVWSQSKGSGQVEAEPVECRNVNVVGSVVNG
jgi:hypothetical protein